MLSEEVQENFDASGIRFDNSQIHTRDHRTYIRYTYLRWRSIEARETRENIELAGADNETCGEERGSGCCFRWSRSNKTAARI